MHERAFPCAVGAEYPDDLALAAADAHVVEGDHVLEEYHHLKGFKHGIYTPSLPRYASRTLLSSMTSSGSPSCIFSPKLSAMTRVGNLEKLPQAVLHHDERDAFILHFFDERQHSRDLAHA